MSYRFLDRHAYYFTRSGRRVAGSGEVAIPAPFSGERSTGVLQDEFRSPHLRCRSGAVRLIGSRAGTRRAPLQRGCGHRRLPRARPGVLLTYPNRPPRPTFSPHVFLPWRVVDALTIHWDLDCTNRMFRETTSLGLLPLHRSQFGLSFSSASRGRVACRTE